MVLSGQCQWPMSSIFHSKYCLDILNPTYLTLYLLSRHMNLARGQEQLKTVIVENTVTMVTPKLRNL